MKLDPKKVLVIHFGQLGDVILGLAALREAAAKFPNAHKAVLVGSATADIVRMTGWFDEMITLDRVLMLKSNKAWASWQIIKFARQIRQRGFDLVIDLHSLPETNILGRISGAKHRLYARRDSRSIDRLSNVRPQPPKEDKEIAVSKVYLQVLEPLGVSADDDTAVIDPAASDVELVRTVIPTVSADITTIGLNPGAGNASRRWPMEKFIELASKLSDAGHRVVIFTGPEEKKMVEGFRSQISDGVILADGLKIPKLAAAFSLMDLVVSNDTGPMHLASVMGTPIVLLTTNSAPARYLPATPRLAVVRGETMPDIPVDEVLDAVGKLI